MRAFTRRRGRYVAHMDPTERQILARVVADTAALLGDPPGMSREQAPPHATDAETPEGGELADGPALTSDTDAAAAAGDSEGDSAAPDDTLAGSGDPGDRSDPEDLDDADDPDGADHIRAHLEQLDQDIPPPTDPALARLLPDASRDDPELAGEFRRLTEQDLRDEKVQRLHMVWAALQAPGSKLTIDPAQAMDWAAALTDVRLVLSERLGIRTDEDAEDVYALAAVTRQGELSTEEELRLAMASVYSAFTWLQESLVQVMLPTVED